METIRKTGFMELAEERFSVLEYEDRAVEPEKINKIIEAGLAAPTACNNQPQRILVIDDEAKKEKLNNVVKSRYTAPAAFLVCYDKNESWKRPKDGKCSGDIDTSIVTTHMMLEATALGLGSIWVMFWDPAKMKSEFELDDNIEPVALLIVGYKSESAEPRKLHYISKSKEDILI